MQPLIGVTTAVRTIGSSGITHCTAYTAIISSLERAGALPVMIPSNVSDSTLRAIYERLDGVLLPGGGDIDPVYFHEDRHPETGEADTLRDNAEVQLVRWAVADDLPLFGICRGHQVINVAMGGTLIQDIPSQVQHEKLRAHSLPEDQPRTWRGHEIQLLDANSRLAQIVGGINLSVNSIHHQAVREAAPGFVVTATSEDGLVEAMEMPNKRFALSVQWHPEDLAADDPYMQGLFDAFVRACSERMPPGA
jgi:putative glutamine amidotransferase